MSTGIQPIVPAQMKVQSALSGKRTWKDIVEDFENDIFAADEYKDEKDSPANDGKISTAEKVSHFIKGIGKTFTSMAKNWKSSLGGAIAFGTILTFAPTLSVPLVVLGTAAGALQIGNSIIKAATAKTDKEARLAYQGMGTGLLTFLPSFIGSKAAVKTANKFGVVGNVTEKDSLWKNYIECWKLSFFGQNKGSLNWWQAAKATTSSKLASMFIFSSKGGNGRAKKVVDHINKNLEKTKTDTENELKTEEAKVEQASKDKIEAQNAFEANKKKQEILNAQIERTENDLKNRAKTEKDYLELRDKSIKLEQARYDEAYQRKDDRVFGDNNDRAQNQLPRDMAIQNRHQNQMDTEIMTKAQSEIARLRGETWADYEARTQKMYNDTYVGSSGTPSLKQQVSDLQSEATHLLVEQEAKVKADKKLTEKITELKEKIAKTEKLIEQVKDYTENNTELSKILAELGDFDDRIVDTISHENWQEFAEKNLGSIKNRTAPGKTYKQIILALNEPDMNKIQSEFTQSIAGSGGINNKGRISPLTHDIFTRYASLDDPESILAAYRELHPKVNFWSIDTPLWDGITKTVQTSAAARWLKTLFE